MGIHPRFLKSSMIAKIKKTNIYDIFGFQIHINEEICKNEYMAMRTIAKKCIILIIINEGTVTVRELTVSSRFS